MAQPAPPPGAPPVAPPPGSQPYPPPMPPYYYPPPPQRSSNIVLIIVVIIILVVVVTTVISAILYIMVSGLIDGPGSNPPVIALSTPSVGVNDATITVTGVSRSEPIGNFLATLIVNSTVGNERQVSSSFTITVGADSFQVTFTDTTSLGQLDPGDRFRIVATSGFHPNTEYEFELIWLNTGGPVGFARWTTP